MFCQACGAHRPTRYVSFHQNIGALVIRFPRQIAGHLCIGCIHKYFWECTLITLLVGWLGLISLIISPFLILNNIYYYLSSIGLPREFKDGEGRPGGGPLD